MPTSTSIAHQNNSRPSFCRNVAGSLEPSQSTSLPRNAKSDTSMIAASADNTVIRTRYFSIPRV